MKMHVNFKILVSNIIVRHFDQYGWKLQKIIFYNNLIKHSEYKLWSFTIIENLNILKRRIQLKNLQCHTNNLMKLYLIWVWIIHALILLPNFWLLQFYLYNAQTSREISWMSWVLATLKKGTIKGVMKFSW